MKLNMIEAQSMAKDHFDEHLTRDVEHEKNMVEAAGIEPASDSASIAVSTCVVFLLLIRPSGTRQTRFPVSLGGQVLAPVRRQLPV